MYILVKRDSLSSVQVAVQSSHAMAEFMYEYYNLPKVKDWVTNHKTLILLEATMGQIIEMKVRCGNEGLSFKSFIEPDLHNMETACAFEPVSSVEGRRLFGHLRLIN